MVTHTARPRNPIQVLGDYLNSEAPDWLVDKFLSLSTLPQSDGQQGVSNRHITVEMLISITSRNDRRTFFTTSSQGPDCGT